MALVICVVSVAQRWLKLRDTASGSRDFRRRLSNALTQLPFGGRGWQFCVTLGLLIFSSALSVQIAQGSPLLSHDAFAWLIVALLVAAFVATVTAVLVAALPRLAVAIAALIPRSPKAGQHWVSFGRYDQVVEESDAWDVALFNRPPPISNS
jgi:hypothetical protein